MNSILYHFLATGIQQERREPFDLLEKMLGMPSMREIKALARHPPPQLSGAIQIPASHIHHNRSFQHFAGDHDRTLVIGRFLHLFKFLVLLLLSGHLHPAINNVRLEYSG